MDLMALRRSLLMMQKAGLLPPGYTELKYIQSGFGSYIVTDVDYDNNKTDVLQGEVAFMNGTNSNDIIISGGIANIWGIDFGSDMRKSPYNTKRVTCRFGASGSTHETNLLLGEFATIIADAANSTLSVNGDQITSTTWWRYSGDPNKYLIFARVTQASGNILSKTSAKLKWVEIVGKGKFIPCMRDSDNEVGVYNIITNAFLTNAGTGTFGYETMDGTYVAPVTA